MLIFKNPIPVPCDRRGHYCNLYVCLGPIKHIISSLFFVGRGRTHELNARGSVLCCIKSFQLFNFVCFYCFCFSQGHHDSLARGIAICYARSFHILKLLFVTCCCFSQWPPGFSWQRDCDMIYKVCRDTAWGEGVMPPL